MIFYIKRVKLFSKMQKLWSITIVHLQDIRIKWTVWFAVQLSKTVTGGGIFSSVSSDLLYVTSRILIQTIETDQHPLIIITAKHF